MARVMYLDCFSGAAGDMLLAALLDAGLPADVLRAALGSLGVEHHLHITRVTRAGIAATHLSVHAGHGTGHAHTHPHTHAHDAPHHEGPHGHHTLAEIQTQIERCGLSTAGKARAVSLFRRLGEAEAAIHDMPIEQVHLHEVGAVDSIIDIVGAVFGLEWFGIDDVVASPLNVGGGTVQIVHGAFPVPAPATLRLLAGVPVYSSGLQTELVTPTGALLVSDYARSFGPMPAMTVERIGYGAGTKDLGPAPNVLRVVIGERTSSAGASRPGLPADAVIEIVCAIDDMNPQLFGPLINRLLASGALDAYLTPVQMKKGRPGLVLTVLAPALHRQAICDLVFRETTTIGLRVHRVEREVLDRRWEEVTLPGGIVRIKVAGRGADVLNAAPEFEDCLKVADATGQPVKAVQASAMRAWLERGSH
jgi:hypothetical protein